MRDVMILIPAAGASRRMRGRDKLLECVDGVAMLRRQACIALATCAPVTVTLAPEAPARRAALEELAVRICTVADADEGMSASLRAGAAHLPPGIAGVMILPADMPDLTAEDLRRVIDAFEADGGRTIIRATAADGRAGHPVVFPAALVAEFAALRGDAGARAILRRNADRIRAFVLPDERAVTDLDTPEDWDLWRARRGDEG